MSFCLDIARVSKSFNRAKKALNGWKGREAGAYCDSVVDRGKAIDIGGLDFENRTRSGHLVGGECSHYCAILFLLSFMTLAVSDNYKVRW